MVISLHRPKYLTTLRRTSRPIVLNTAPSEAAAPTQKTPPPPPPLPMPSFLKEYESDLTGFALMLQDDIGYSRILRCRSERPRVSAVPLPPYVDDRAGEILALERITLGMNGTPSSNQGADPTPIASALASTSTFSPHSQTAPQQIPTSSNSREFLDPYDGASALGTSPGSRTTSGKSGRVIEKLMAENDRLRRELKVETTAREEERKAKEAIRQARDSLQSTNQNLQLQKNIDHGMLQRKDRKIEELKAARDFEREQRMELDDRSRIQVKEADEQVQDLKNAHSRANEERKLAVNQYDTCKEGFKRLDDSYRQRVERIKSQMDTLQSERERDRRLLQRLEVTAEQQRQELEKLRLAKNSIVEKCQSVLDKAETDMGQIRKMAASQEGELERTVDEAKEALHALRRLIGVEKAFRPTE